MSKYLFILLTTICLSGLANEKGETTITHKDIAKGEQSSGGGIEPEKDIAEGEQSSGGGIEPEKDIAVLCEAAKLDEELNKLNSFAKKINDEIVTNALNNDQNS